LRTVLSEHPSEVEPSSAIAATMAAMTEIVRDRMREFGSAGQTGPKIETSVGGNTR
jgi:fructose-bisphosphate aldolase, class II